MGPRQPYPAPMETNPRPALGPTRDRWIALGAVALSALLAAGWVTRERQLATDLAESREDLRQAMHRLQTVSASTDQIRAAYLQRQTELEVAKRKIDQLAQRQTERKKEAPVAEKKKSARETPASPSADPSDLFATIRALQLPPWVAIQKTDTSVRLLPGVSAPAGNEGFAAFGALAHLLAEADPDMSMELQARAEPGSDALETAQDRAKRLFIAAERSMNKEVSRIRIVAEVAKGPRMEWRLVPAPPTPKAQPVAP